MKKYLLSCLLAMFILLLSIMAVLADSITYTYDSNNRLTLETRVNGSNTTTIQYFYDNNGNLIDKVTRITSLKTGTETENFETIGQ